MPRTGTSNSTRPSLISVHGNGRLSDMTSQRVVAGRDRGELVAPLSIGADRVASVEQHGDIRCTLLARVESTVFIGVEEDDASHTSGPAADHAAERRCHAAGPGLVAQDQIGAAIVDVLLEQTS